MDARPTPETIDPRQAPQNESHTNKQPNLQLHTSEFKLNPTTNEHHAQTPRSQSHKERQSPSESNEQLPCVPSGTPLPQSPPRSSNIQPECNTAKTPKQLTAQQPLTKINTQATRQFPHSATAPSLKRSGPPLPGPPSAKRKVSYFLVSF